MDTMPKYNPLARAIALVLVTLPVAYLTRYVDSHSLAKMDSMTPTAYIEYRHHLFGHSYLFAFVVLLVLGGFYLGVVDTVTFVTRALMPKSRSD